MSVAVIYRCTICNEIKKQTNHWFVAEQTNVGIHFHTWEWAAREDRLQDESTMHLCGERCSHEMLGRFLNSKKENTNNGTDPAQ